MTIDDIVELHFITLIENVPSIVNHGILSYRESRRLKASSVANPVIQDRRQNKSVPNAGPLHSYANLYFHARNPMMCAIQGRREELAVLKVSRQVLYEAVSFSQTAMQPATTLAFTSPRPAYPLCPAGLCSHETGAVRIRLPIGVRKVRAVPRSSYRVWSRRISLKAHMSVRSVRKPA
jgi:hypothetical protein